MGIQGNVCLAKPGRISCLMVKLIPIKVENEVRIVAVTFQHCLTRQEKGTMRIRKKKLKDPFLQMVWLST